VGLPFPLQVHVYQDQAQYYIYHHKDIHVGIAEYFTPVEFIQAVLQGLAILGYL
jgi:hypothetical protein